MVPDQSSLQCGCRPVADVAYEGDGGRAPSEAVVDAIAAVSDAAPRDLPPLHESIDQDALNQLFRHRPGTSGRVLSFAVGDWNVFVRDDGRIRVCDPTGPGAPSPVFD